MLTAVALAVAGAAPFTGAPTAPVTVDSYRLVIRATGEGREVRTVAFPERYRIRSSAPDLPVIVGRNGTETYARTADGPGSVFRNLFAAEPEGFNAGADRYAGLAAYVLAQARAGTLVLQATRLAGRPAWRAEVDVPANDCAGLPPRRVRIWLAQRTHLPLRVVERVRSSGRVLVATSYAYSALNARFPAVIFAPPTVGTGPFVLNAGFRRTSPAAAAGPLPYTPRLPAVLPAGFRLAVAGWAPRSGRTGAEGSIPPAPWLFGAVYRRGPERIDITQRVARRAWPDSPFGAECLPLRTEAVTINGVAATFGIGQSTVPHLYWRDGPLLYTVSGPFPRDDLLAIAASLRRLGS